MTQAPATPELVERLRGGCVYSDADRTLYLNESATEDLLEEAADALEAQQARIAELEAQLMFADSGLDAVESERDIWRKIAEDRLAKLEASQALADRYEKALRLAERELSFAVERMDRRGGSYEAALTEVRQALSSQGRREGGEDSSSRSHPCGVGPSDLTDPQSQHSDGGRDD